MRHTTPHPACKHPDGCTTVTDTTKPGKCSIAEGVNATFESGDHHMHLACDVHAEGHMVWAQDPNKTP
jgi:hypothetical protein